MGLDPRRSKEEIWQDKLNELFRPGESPYFGMYNAGLAGVPFELISNYLGMIGVPIRFKDIQNWKDGMFRHQMHYDSDVIKPERCVTQTGVSFEQAKLEDFPMYPQNWTTTERRFFPCTSDNRPMGKWGWRKGFIPELYDYASAKALSPCGWVGQNMLYQRFIVVDIDGVGHGQTDEAVIAFGNKYKQFTRSYEDPSKVGSFHLYFSTDRIIPVKHFPWAKLDLMGNAVNAAVYMKNKISNNLPMIPLTNNIWQEIISYTNSRKDI